MNQKVLKFLLLLVAIVAFAYSFNILLRDEWRSLYAKYFPCRSPITYSITSFDSRFGISEEALIKALGQAEKIWEEPIGRDLFSITEDVNSDVDVNLVYDYRQEATEKIHDLGLVVSDTRHSYDTLRAKYDTLQAKYSKDKADYDRVGVEFSQRQSEYNKKVDYWNSQGGAPEKEYEALNKEAEELKQALADWQAMEKNLNAEINNINALVVVINSQAKKLNLSVLEIDKVGKSQGEEFTQGEYKTGPDGDEIDVYEWSNDDKLVRLLAHEFGHALGLGHVEDSGAIMYRLNESKNNKASEADLSALRDLCKIK